MSNLLFSELKEVSPEILNALSVMGFSEATPVQSESILPILKNMDVTAQAPTGTGKTFAFGIPLIDKIDANAEAVQGLILCPTRELAIQVSDELRKLAQFKPGVKVVTVYGGQQIERQIMALKRKPQVIVATPGRMLDHLRRKTIKIAELKTVVLDEADEMLNMGFREDIDLILETVPEDRQTVLFSATISKEIHEISDKYQKKDKKFIKVTPKELTVSTVEQYYIEAKGPKKLDVLTRILDVYNYKLCLIFCNTKSKTDEITAELGARGYAAEALHGDMKQAQRDKVMNKFRKGNIRLLVATDVAARGIDVDDIEAVFNYDVPADEEYYVHRIGRTGRAKKKGASYTFAASKEMFKLRDIMRYTKTTIAPFKAPSAADAEEIRVKNLLARLNEIIKNEDLSKYIYLIEKNINEDAFNGLTAYNIAAALMSLTLTPAPVAEQSGGGDAEIRQKKRKTAKAGMTRLFITLGAMDRLKPNGISELITSNSPVPVNEIGIVNVFDKFSFAEVPSKYAEQVINALHKTEYKGRKIAVEEADSIKKPEKKQFNKNVRKK